MAVNLWNEIKHFKPGEFDSPDLPGSGEKMNIEFIKILDRIREDCKFPFTINSGYRTDEHNAKVGGKPKSAHTLGMAVDIHCNSGHELFLIVQSALKHGIKRVGLARTFVHLDMSFNHPQEVAWFY